MSLERKEPLKRRTPLRAQPRAKGNRFERLVIDMLKERGWSSAYRNFQSGGQGGGDVIGGPANVHIEAKHRETLALWKWLAQAEAEARPTDIPIVVFKRNGSQVYAVLPFDELLALLQLRESG
jgi:hypothetical protein